MGDEAARLLALAGPDARVAVISNALDFIPPAARQAYADNGGFTAEAWFAEQGLSVRGLDLRAFFAAPGIERALDDIDLVWAVGGKAFLLLRAIRQSGLEPVLKRRLAEDSLMYGGWSAGACVAGASLRGIHLMDEPDRTAEGYQAAPQWDGMALVDRVIVPHFKSDHAEAEAADAAVAWLQREGLAFQTLRDGQSLIVGR